MKTKLLIDKNIFIYAYDLKSVYNPKAIMLLEDKSFVFFSSTKNLSEFFAVLSKQGEPFQKVWQFYQSICSNTTILFPDKISIHTI